MFKRLSFYLALAGIAVAIVLVQKVRRVEPPAPPVKPPTSAPFERSIGARGIIESVDENVRVAPAIAGRVTAVKVAVGSHVKEGDVLFELDARDAAAAVAAEEAQVVKLRAQVEEASIGLADKKDQSERIEKLSETRVSSVDERQRARFGTQLASAGFERVRGDLGVAEAQLNRSRVLLDLLTVKAPRDGTVLQVNIRAGEYAALSAMEPAMLLGKLDQFQLRADVDEDNASQVRAEATAFAFIKGRRDLRILLTFVRIEPYIVPKRSLTGQSSERVDTRVLQIIYRFEPPTEPEKVAIYVGQQMDVFIEAPQK